MQTLLSPLRQHFMKVAAVGCSNEIKYFNYDLVEFYEVCTDTTSDAYQIDVINGCRILLEIQGLVAQYISNLDTFRP